MRKAHTAHNGGKSRRWDLYLDMFTLSSNILFYIIYLFL